VRRLEVADDLVHVLDDADDGLVLVDHAVDAEAPDRGAAQRREQHAPHAVAERVAEAALERLQAELAAFAWSSRFVISTSCGRTKPRRSIVVAIALDPGRVSRWR
jgi:hypothetical protein